MKRKILMLLMAGLLSFAMMAGCGNSTEPVAEAEEEEEDDRNLADEIEDEAEPEPEPVQAAEPEEEPEPEEEKELDMPRSDAYEMFLAGEMDVNVLEDPNDPYAEYMIPAKGTYSYDELIDAILGEYPGKYDVKYTMFTPALGEEGDDVFVLYLENHDPSFYSWIGFIAYDTDGLNMRYCKEFGYRSFFDLYYDGYVLTGGSNGAGAQDFNCHCVLPDSSLRTLFKSSHLYSSWCGDITWTLDPDMDYELRPTLTYDSGLEMKVLYFGDDDVRFTVTGYSDNKSVKAEEERFIQAIREMGAVEIDEDEYDSLTSVDIDESKLINLSNLSTYDTVEKEIEY
ncbi:MAG: hypothetical protein J6W48_09895 [Lachnospiraceae bacterium]|nr:hypothetical protein [Lachnospiraceae bacterium]